MSAENLLLHLFPKGKVNFQFVIIYISLSLILSLYILISNIYTYTKFHFIEKSHPKSHFLFYSSKNFSLPFKKKIVNSLFYFFNYEIN